MAASLIAVRVIAERIELHVRGVTAEPWGRGRTTLERDTSGVLRMLPMVYDAALPTAPSGSIRTPRLPTPGAGSS